MKKNFIILGLILILVPMIISSQGMGKRYNQSNYNYIISDFPAQEISDTEKQALIKMREEEKLARDVYQTLYQKWNVRIFSNISKSEETHMSTIKLLLDKYNISDPIKDNDVGKFSSKEFEELYNKLIELGNKSLVDALKVGATIEDLDIYDLQTLMLKIDNVDILFAFTNLKKGSENHIRAFTSYLSSFGVVYTAQYISQEELETILNSESNNGKNRRRRGRW